MYRKLGNKNLLLTHTSVRNYPTPWTMWGGNKFRPGDHIGNVKIGPAGMRCPEDAKVNESYIVFKKVKF